MIVREGGCVWCWARYGRVEWISAGLVSKAVSGRSVHIADLSIRCILLQIVLPIIAISLPGNECVCHRKGDDVELRRKEEGGRRAFGRGWIAE